MFPSQPYRADRPRSAGLYRRHRTSSAAVVAFVLAAIVLWTVSANTQVKLPVGERLVLVQPCSGWLSLPRLYYKVGVAKSGRTQDAQSRCTCRTKAACTILA